MVASLQLSQTVRPRECIILLVFMCLLGTLSSQVCISKKYPVGLGGTSGEIAFTAVDFDDTGTHVVVGGWCKDSGLCHSSNAQPIIQMVLDADRSVLWRKYQAVENEVEAVKFHENSANFATTKVAVTLKRKNDKLTFISLKASDGTVLKVLTVSGTEDSSWTTPQSLLFTAYDKLIVALTLNKRWTLLHFSMIDGDVKNLLRGDYEESRAYAVMQDPLGDAVYVLGRGIDSQSKRLGYHHTRVKFSSGSVASTDWTLYKPDVSSDYEPQFADIESTNGYLWSCHVDDLDANNAVTFSKLKTRAAITSQISDRIKIYLTKSDNSECYGIQSVSSQSAYMVGLFSSKKYLGRIKCNAHTCNDIELYNMEAQFDSGTTDIKFARFKGTGIPYFVGHMERYGSTANPNGKQSAFLAKVDQAPSTSESCTTFKTGYDTKISLHVKEFTEGKSPSIADYTGVFISLVVSSPSSLTIEASTSLNDIVIPASLESYCAETPGGLTLSAPSSMPTGFTYNAATRVPGTESYTVPVFTLSPSSCVGSEVITYSNRTVTGPFGLTFDPATRTFNWSTATTNNVYTIIINANTAPSSLSATASFTLTVVGVTPAPTPTPAPSPAQSTNTTTVNPSVPIVQNLGPPYFDPELKDIIIKLGTGMTFKFPSLLDPDPGDSGVISSLNLGKASAFISGKFPNLFLKPTKSSDLGTFPITLTVRDDNKISITATYTFQVTVTGDLATPQEAAKPVNATQNQTSNTSVPAVPLSLFTSPLAKPAGKGKVRSKPLPLTAGISRVSSEGQVDVRFNKNVLQIKNLTAIDDKVIQIQVKAGRDSNPEYLKIVSWNVVSMINRELRFKLIFENPLRISSQQERDKLEIVILNHNFIVDEETMEPIKVEKPLKRAIPRQLAQDDASAMLSGSGKTVKAGATTLMMGNLALNILMATSLQFLWGMINVMQLIVHMPLLNVIFPTNAVTFYNFIIDVSSFDIIPTDWIRSKLFNFTETENDSQFSSMGYQSPNIVENLGSMLVYLLLIILAIIFVFAIRHFKNKYEWLKIIYDKLSKIIFFNLILRTFLEGYIEFALTSLMNLSHLSWGSSSDRFASLVAVTACFAVFFFPLFVWWLLWRKQHVLRDQTSILKFGSTYSEIKTDSKAALLYNVVFMLRRLLFSLIAVLMDGSPVLQVQLLIFHCILMLIYNILVQPFEDPTLNYLEIFNELCIIGAAYHMITFTDFLVDPEVRYEIGWSIIGITTFNIAVNMIFMSILSLRKLFQTLKRVLARVKAWLSRKKAYQDVGQTENFTSANSAQLKGRTRKFPEMLSQVEEEELKSDLQGCPQEAGSQDTNDQQDSGIIEKHQLSPLYGATVNITDYLKAQKGATKDEQGPVRGEKRYKIRRVVVVKRRDQQTSQDQAIRILDHDDQIADLEAISKISDKNLRSGGSHEPKTAGNRRRLIPDDMIVEIGITQEDHVNPLGTASFEPGISMGSQQLMLHDVKAEDLVENGYYGFTFRQDQSSGSRGGGTVRSRDTGRSQDSQDSRGFQLKLMSMHGKHDSAVTMLPTNDMNPPPRPINYLNAQNQMASLVETEEDYNMNLSDRQRPQNLAKKSSGGEWGQTDKIGIQRSRGQKGRSLSQV